jgi:serine/threonine protein kinase
MDTNDRLEELLERWELSRAQGTALTPEELCVDQPALIDEVRRRIKALLAMDSALETETGAFVASEHVDFNGLSSSQVLPQSMQARSVYRPQTYHARGGLGEVLTAHQEELDRTVALKRILPEARSEQARMRFLREAAITARLQHPGIVPIYGLGQDDDGPFYTMPFIRGKTLREAIFEFHQDESLRRDAGPRSLRFRELLQQFITVCNTIGYAHDQGIVHRDLKPSNIMLGQYGETLVVDWGLAKRIGAAGGEAIVEGNVPSPDSSPFDVTAVGDILGTRQYMSPEQARGEPVGHAGDIFSLGLILYEILTGRPAYDTSTLPRGLSRESLWEARIEPPRSRDPGVPRALEKICLKALATRPEGRYASTNALADDVNRWLADEPVTAHGEGWNERLARWARRNRAAVGAVTFALLAGLATAAGVQARSNAVLTEARDKTKQALTEVTDANNRTRAALATSEELRKQAEAISALLAAVFRSPDPSQDGSTIKVVDFLDRAAEEVDKHFDGPLAAKGALLDALGHSYLSLGPFDLATVWLTKAQVVCESALGPNHPDTLRVCTNLALALGE